jgi:hypothetical protein
MKRAGPLRSSLLVVVLLGLSAAVAVGSAADEPDDEVVVDEPPSELVCEGMVMTVHNDYVPAEEMRGAPPHPRAALAYFLSFDHGYLRASEFRQTRGTATTAHFVHDARGRPLVTAEVEQYGDGWLVMEMAACNEFLEEEARG